MSKAMLLFVLLLSAFVVVASGCGGADTGSVDVSNPNSLLLTIRELPDGATIGEAPPELCGPLPVLRKNGGRTAISRMFSVERARVVEAVGVFNGPATAKSAFNNLNDRKRLECIGDAIRTFGSASLVKIVKLQPPNIGDESAVVRYVAFDGGPERAEGNEFEPNGRSDVVALRVGRCTAALLIAIEGNDPPGPVSEETMETVADRLSDACR